MTWLTFWTILAAIVLLWNHAAHRNDPKNEE
jgi:hypothetical protein